VSRGSEKEGKFRKEKYKIRIENKSTISEVCEGEI
jgi:hypothetical protein